MENSLEFTAETIEQSVDQIRSLVEQLVKEGQPQDIIAGFLTFYRGVLVQAGQQYFELATQHCEILDALERMKQPEGLTAHNKHIREVAISDCIQAIKNRTMLQIKDAGQQTAYNVSNDHAWQAVKTLLDAEELIAQVTAPTVTGAWHTDGSYGPPEIIETVVEGYDL